MSEIATDILIIGSGPAGLAAAAAASSSGLSVTVVDDNPEVGGQIWRAQVGKLTSPEAASFLTYLDNDRIRLISGAQVVSTQERSVCGTTANGTVTISFNKVILATGARERFLPFPGWTLPGVFGAGGLQAMVKGGLAMDGKRVVIAGTGPLLLAVADYLKAKGANVLLIAEQTSGAKIRRFARGLWRSPDKMVQAAALRARLIGIPYKTDCWVTSARSGANVSVSPSLTRGLPQPGPLVVALTQRRRSWEIECDYLACAYHLVPNLELASLLGCEIDDGFVSTDSLQQTTVENVLCAGEPTGIGGLEAALIEGKIAGFAAAGMTDQAREHSGQRERTNRFTRLLDRTFGLRDELRGLAKPETIVCRCEDVMFDQLHHFTSFREAKLQTRCGMGPCQGRICGPATQFLFGWERPTVRPPIFPVKMEDL